MGASGTEKVMKLGVLIPHFGQSANRGLVIEGSQQVEEFGFDSVWVRDHLVWSPHTMEGVDQTFLEPLLTLSAIAAVTERITLGTAVLIPVRWPLKLAQNLATLSHLAGGRLIAGVGLGNDPIEFAAAGFERDDRKVIFRETLEIAHRVWEGDDVDYRGEYFSFEGVTIRPKPVEPIPFVYGGTTRASVRRAVQLTSGWLPGRIPLGTLDDRLTYLRGLAEEAGKDVSVGVIPVFSVHEDRDKARSVVDVPTLASSSAGSKHWVTPASGEFQTVEDLEGLVVAGNPDDCIKELEKFRQRDIDYVVIDLRLDFNRYIEQLELLAEHVLPAFH